MSTQSMIQARASADRATSLSLVAAVAFLLLYAFVLLRDPALGIVDDWVLLNTIYSGHPLPLAIFPKIGRLSPLEGQEYNLIALLSTDLFWFYAFNLVELLAFALIALRVQRLVGLELKYALLGLVVFLLTPGFVSVWFRLLVGERGAALCFLAFVWLYLEARNGAKTRYLIFSIISANVGLYYKEPGFLLVGTFAAANLIFSWPILSRRFRAANGVLLASAVGYLVIYLVAVYPQRGDSMYGGVGLVIMSRFLRNIGNYALNDPLLVFVLLPLSAARLWQTVVRKRTNPRDVVFDAMLFASAAYVLGFFGMGLYSAYYLLPAYMLAAPGLTFFLLRERYRRRPMVRVLFAAFAVLLAVNVLPAGLNLISAQKYVPPNYRSTNDFLAGYLNASGREPTRLFLDGLPPDRDTEIYSSFQANLMARGVSCERFALASTVKAIDSAQWRWLKGFPVLNDAEVRPGDLLIITPYTQVSHREAYLAALGRAYELVFATESPFAVPDMTLHRVVKALLVSRPAMRGVLDINGLPSARWPDFYVFRAKESSVTRPTSTRQQSGNPTCSPMAGYPGHIEPH